jgi:hypothetical protein
MADASPQEEQTTRPTPPTTQNAEVTASQSLTSESPISPGAKPVSSQPSPLWIELVAKLTPTIVAIAAGAWVLSQYWDFQKEQNKVSLQISKNQLERSRTEQLLAQQQTTIHGLEIGRKSAFQIQTHPRLAVDVLSSPEAKTGSSRYLITWEVSITNLGNREISIVEHQAEILLGSPKGSFPKDLSIVELNLPDRKEGPIAWTSGIHRTFTAQDLDGVSLGSMSPGDRRHGEIHAAALAQPGTWVFARTRLKLKAISHDNKLEEDKHVEWAFEIIPRRERGSSKSALQRTPPQPGAAEGDRGQMLTKPVRP